MSAFWTSQLDYVFLIYGLSFILMAAQCLVLRRRDRSLPWGLLAALGALSGSLNGLNAACRYALGLPGAAVTGSDSRSHRLARNDCLIEAA